MKGRVQRDGGQYSNLGKQLKKCNFGKQGDKSIERIVFSLPCVSRTIFNLNRKRAPKSRSEAHEFPLHFLRRRKLFFSRHQKRKKIKFSSYERKR